MVRGTSALARQIENGAPADIFISDNQAIAIFEKFGFSHLFSITFCDQTINGKRDRMKFSLSKFIFAYF